MDKFTVAIGGDHAGFAMKNNLAKHLKDEGHRVLDLGTDSAESTDYPQYAHAVARSVISGQAAFGILVCGSGNGMNITANKHRGVRAALAWDPEIATLARTHNDANVLTLPARFIPEEMALRIADRFLSADFEGGRHARRVDQIETTDHRMHDQE